MERARRCIDLVKEGDYVGLGAMMTISHNGDRVWRQGQAFDYHVGDECLLERIADLKSEDENRVSSAQIWRQPGGYACSTREIDDLVDDILAQEGVLGAELSGAGLGGCILALVRTDAVDSLLRHLEVSYYEKNRMAMGAQVVRPVAGSMVL
jgi:N-acetylgalactosamine kinase